MTRYVLFYNVTSLVHATKTSTSVRKTLYFKFFFVLLLFDDDDDDVDERCCIFF